MSTIESTTSFLWNTTQAKDVAKILLVTQSAENLVSCLNSLLKAGAVIASAGVGSDPQEKVNICHLALLAAVSCYSHTTLLTCFSTLGTGYMDIFLCLTLVTYFPTHDIGYTYW